MPRDPLRRAGVLADTDAYLGTSATVVRDVTAAGALDSAIDSAGARLASATSSGAFGWLVPDLHGSVAGATSATGASVTDAFRSDACGKTSAAVTNSLPTPWRDQGRLREAVSGQYDFGARSYDPALGAFTSLDTLLGQAQHPVSLNRYVYAQANPTSMIDPDGHAARRLTDGGGGPPSALAAARAAVAAARQAADATGRASRWAALAAVGLSGPARSGRLAELAARRLCRRRHRPRPGPGSPCRRARHAAGRRGPPACGAARHGAGRCSAAEAGAAATPISWIHTGTDRQSLGREVSERAATSPRDRWSRRSGVPGRSRAGAPPKRTGSPQMQRFGRVV